MRVYIASMFSDKDRVARRAEELTAMGIECTSRWAYEAVPHNVTMKECTKQYLEETAVADVQDILKADIVVLTVPELQLLVDATVSAASRGGRHFESGLFYGLILAQMFDGGKPIRELIIMGHHENVFHRLNGEGVTSIYPAIRVIETWEEVKKYLEEQNALHQSD